MRFGYASNGVADVWDFATGKRVRRLAESQATFRSGTFTADGRFVLVGAAGTIIQMDGSEGESFSSELTLLDPIAGRVVRGFEVPPVPGSVLHRYSGPSALSPDGRTLYVSYNTGDIVCYEVASGKPRRTLTGHRGLRRRTGGSSADGRRLISGGRDTTALVWDVTLAGTQGARGQAADGRRGRETPGRPLSGTTREPRSRRWPNWRVPPTQAVGCSAAACEARSGRANRCRAGPNLGRPG